MRVPPKFRWAVAGFASDLGAVRAVSDQLRVRGIMEFVTDVLVTLGALARADEGRAGDRGRRHKGPARRHTRHEKKSPDGGSSEN